jgi:hypothetical protein
LALFSAPLRAGGADAIARFDSGARIGVSPVGDHRIVASGSCDASILEGPDMMYAFGVTPVSVLKTRWKWKRLIPAASASAPSRGASSAASISRQALSTLAVRWSLSAGAFGRHRLHGRNPAISASSRVEWKRTFSRRASLDAQDGRQ